MRKSVIICNDLHDILARSALPDILISRDLAHDALQRILYTRKRILELEDALDVAREDRKRDRIYHLEAFGRMARVLKQYACECSEECEEKPEDASYCGWTARQAMEGKV
jgi:hypothetical protein